MTWAWTQHDLPIFLPGVSSMVSFTGNRIVLSVKVDSPTVLYTFLHMCAHTCITHSFPPARSCQKFPNTQNLRGMCELLFVLCGCESEVFLRSVSNGEMALSLWVVIMLPIWITFQNVQNMFTSLSYAHLLRLGLLGCSLIFHWVHKSPAGIAVVPGGSSGLKGAFIVFIPQSCCCKIWALAHLLSMVLFVCLFV